MSELALYFEEKPFTVHFRYPAVLPSGRQYLIHVRETDLVSKRHFMSEDKQELYFEVVRYKGAQTHAEGYALFTADLRKQFEVIEIEPLRPMELNGYAAEGFGFEWPEARRQVGFVLRPDALYRILYDPRIPLNLEILETVSFD